MTEKTNENSSAQDTEKLVINLVDEPRAIPRAFIAWHCEYGFLTLRQYLEKSGAPDEMLGLVDGLECLASLLENDMPRDGGEEFLGGALANLARGLHAAGAELHSPASIIQA